MRSFQRLQPALLALALPFVLGSCAALGSILSTEPSVDSAGPLSVGKTYSVSGVIDGGPVSVSVPVTALYNVVNGRSTVTDRDKIAALDRNRSGYVSASFFTAPSESLKFEWLGAAQGGVSARYSCDINTILAAPYTGVLTLQRGGNSYRGTCSVSSD